MLGVEFPRYPSEATGKITVLGSGWPTISRTVTMTLPPYEDLTWEAEIDFVLDEGLPWALLGREGFLNHWGVTFSAYHGYFTVEDCETFHERRPAALTDLRQEHFPGSIVP